MAPSGDNLGKDLKTLDEMDAIKYNGTSIRITEKLIKNTTKDPDLMNVPFYSFMLFLRDLCGEVVRKS